MSDLVLPAVDAPVPGAETSALEIRLFGPMEVRTGRYPLPRLRTRKGLWLLALLALRAERDVERDWLAGTLWPEGSEAQARRSLRQSLHDLRRVLGSQAWRLAGAAPRMLRLDLCDASVDVLTFDAALARGDADSLETAVRLYRGPLLAECAEEWVLEERQPREQAYVAGLERLAAAATARGEHGAAATYLRRAVIADPYREELQRALMQALAEGGSPSGAMLVYWQYRALLGREMAAEPAAETAALFRRLREETRARARPCAPSPSVAAPPPEVASHLSPAPGPRGNLPQPLSAFVGRERELLEVGACLASARLVTLTGPGGIGKTRLAIRAAEECAGEYADGAWFVDLAALADPALVPRAVARTLRVPEVPDSPLTETLQEALGARQLLLVLDNCEHLLDACARLASTLLSFCPHLRILATSRQALGLTGEITWSVSPLSLPVLVEGSGTPRREGGLKVEGPTGTDRVLPSTFNFEPSTLLESEAVRLFVERAKAATVGFTLTERNAAATVQVCRRLDGIPLAIELAAARLKALSVEQIAARLDDRFHFLTGGSRAALPRHQTLRATMDWSFELLAEPERILFRRLSVFAGGFTLEAAEAVCSDSGSGTDPSAIQNPRSKILNAAVLDLLTQLVDRSLVRVESREGTARYDLLETTREYARERLREAGEIEERRGRHARFFLALAERAEPELRGAAQAEWLQRLEEEHDNCRAALDHFLAQGAVEEGLRLGGALGWFWWLRGYFSEGRERLQALLAQSGYEIGSPESDSEFKVARPRENAGHSELHPPGIRRAQAKALNGAGMLADEQSDYEAARALFQESLALCRQLGDPAGAAAALKYLGGQAMRARNLAAARSLYEESLAISRGIGDQWSAAASLTSLGRVALLERDYATARALVESGLAIQRQLQDRRAMARSLTTLGNIAGRLGDDEAARTLYEESLSLARELGARGVIEETLNVLGSVARNLGDHDAALAYHEERLTIAREVGNLWGISEGLVDLALLAYDRGEESRAAALWSESLAISQRLGGKECIAVCLEGFASLAARPGPREPGPRDRGSNRSGETVEGRDSAQRAARLFGAAAALRELADVPHTPPDRAEIERRVAAARARLDAASFAAAWAEGAAMDLDQVIAYALD